MVEVLDKTLFIKEGQGPNSKFVSLNKFSSMFRKSRISPFFKNKFLPYNNEYQSISEYFAYEFCIEKLLTTGKLLPEFDKNGKLKYFYFKDKTKYKKTLLGMDWGHYPLPYRMPHADMLHLQEVKRILFEIKENWISGKWEKVLGEHLAKESKKI